jgi:hypothetical protein
MHLLFVCRVLVRHRVCCRTVLHRRVRRRRLGRRPVSRYGRLGRVTDAAAIATPAATTTVTATAESMAATT